MPEIKPPTKTPTIYDITISDPAVQDEKLPPTQVILDPSSPSVRSIVRVVVITLLLLAVAGFFLHT